MTHFQHLPSALALTLLATTPFTHAAVTTFTYGGHGYAIIDGKTSDAATWIAANIAAASRTDNGWSAPHLVVINDANENTAVFNQLSLLNITTTAADGGGTAYAWIGFQQTGSPATPAANWNWVDGTSSYTHWGTGTGGSEPDDYDLGIPGVENGGQNYAAIGLGGWPVFQPGYYGNAGQWNDLSNTNSLAYVVEFNTVPEPSTVWLACLGLLGLAHRKR